MAFVRVNADLTKIKNKVALNLTKRQLVCFGTAAAIGIPTYLLARGTIGNSPAVLLMIGVMLPLFFLAMYEKDGMPAEIILRNIIRTKFLWAGTRPYKTENLYEIMEREGKNIGKQTETAAKTAVRKRPASKR
ncbi:hypothetical protein FACS1894219_00020 [Clostridia bacterium]|nr:hypothetical protein FACS1894219_00020 [Clostridia bacterium]